MFAKEDLRLCAKCAHVLQRLRVLHRRVERERADFSQQLHGSIRAGFPGGLISDKETGTWRTFTYIQGVEDFHGERDF